MRFRVRITTQTTVRVRVRVKVRIQWPRGFALLVGLLWRRASALLVLSERRVRAMLVAGSPSVPSTIPSSCSFKKKTRQETPGHDKTRQDKTG